MLFQIGDLVHTESTDYIITNPSTICEVLDIYYDEDGRERIRIRVKAWKPNKPRECEMLVNSSMERHEDFSEIASNFKLYQKPRKITI